MTEFRNQVKEGNFEKAYELAKEMDLDLIAEELLNLGEENCNMLAYGYIVFGLLKKETIEYHWLASTLLSVSLYNSMDSSIELAFKHVKRAMELDETSFMILNEFRFLASHPDSSGTKEDVEYANKIIAELFPEKL